MCCSRWLSLLPIILFLGLSHTGFSQSNYNDSLDYHRQLALFDEAIGIENTELINGPKYVAPRASDSHPFYHSPIAAPGSLTFDGQPYFNLTLLYDVYSDALVVQQLRSMGNYELIAPNKSEIETFTIHTHNFRNFHGGEAKELGIADGYYDVLHDGDGFKIIARRKKTTKVEMGKVVYEGDDKYLFVLDGKKAVNFRGMKDLSSLFSDNDRKSQLAAFAKENGLKIKKRDSDVVTLAKYCDILLGKRK